MKKNTFIALLLAIVGSFSCAAYADLTVIFGKPVEIYADPSDVVVVLDNAGPCGSKYFHIQRTNTNFKEFNALVLSAFTSGKTLHFFVASCNGDRNILSHGSMF